MSSAEFAQVAFKGLDGKLMNEMHTFRSSEDVARQLPDTGDNGVWAIYIIKMKDDLLYVGHSQTLRNRLLYGGPPHRKHAPHGHLHQSPTLLSRLFGKKGPRDWKTTVDHVVWREAENGTILATLKETEMTARASLTGAGYRLTNVSRSAGGPDKTGKYRSPLRP